MSSIPKFCSKCGAPLEESDRFCPVCGIKIPDFNEPKKNEPAQKKPERKNEIYGQENNRKNNYGLIIAATIIILALVGISYVYISQQKKETQPLSISNSISVTKEEDASALYKKALNYMYGKGVVQDKKKAMDFLQKSADLGYPDALYDLGEMYAYGEEVQKDRKKSIELWEKAANKGQSSALFQLGVIYYATSDSAVQKDEKKAMEFWQKSADRGNPEALFSLGHMYSLSGNTLENDKKTVKVWKKAIVLLQKAVEQGYLQAPYDYGILYEIRTGKLKNDKKALELWHKRIEDQIIFLQKLIDIICKDKPSACK